MNKSCITQVKHAVISNGSTHRVEQSGSRVAKDEGKSKNYSREGDKGCECIGSIENEEADKDDDYEGGGDENGIKLCNGRADVLVEAS
jgi:hypothetical protein